MPLTAPQLERYADVLVWAVAAARNRPFRKGDMVRIASDLAARPLAEIVYRKIMEKGWNPVVRFLETPGMERNFYSTADADQLVFIAPGTPEFNEKLNGSIFLSAPESLTHLKKVDTRRIGKAAVARKPLREILTRREEKGAFGWTLCTYPTPELAAKAGLSLTAYTQEIVRACYLDSPRPVVEWQTLFRRAQRLKKALNALRVHCFHVESKGTDLKITPGEKRQWMGVSGHNIPSFELFTSPDWRGTEGVYYANLPSYRSGNYVEGVRLEFVKGSAVRVSARKGEAFVKKMLKMDATSNKVGEFSLTDKRFSRISRFMADILFDENFGGKNGNCHLAVGSSYSDTFAGNPARLTKARKKALGFNDSALHWDLINTEEKRVTAVLKDGTRKVIYEKGVFTLD
ncbi:MAG: aminopeptidase [Fibrobacterota bacterium]